MALWGTSTADESKPKYLSEEEKANTYATNRGWVYKRPDGTEELLVTARGLETSLGAASISSVYFANTAAQYVQGNANSFVTVSYNEKVTVTGTAPTLVVQGSTSNAVATYASGSGTSKLQFKFTTPAATQTLSIPAQTITLASANVITETANSSINVSPTFASSVVVGVNGKGSTTTVSVA